MVQCTDQHNISNLFNFLSFSHFLCTTECLQTKSIFTSTIIKKICEIAVFRLKIFSYMFKVALFQVCDPVPHWGMALLSVTLATLRGVYELGWKDSCVKVGVKLLRSCSAQAQTCLVALSDMRGFRGNGQAFRKVSL